MPEVLLGGNSPDRAQRFVDELRGRGRGTSSGVRSMADAMRSPLEGGRIVEVVPPRVAYVPTVEDLQRLDNTRLREIAETDLGLTIPEDAFKKEIIAAISEVLHGS